MKAAISARVVIFGTAPPAMIRACHLGRGHDLVHRLVQPLQDGLWHPGRAAHAEPAGADDVQPRLAARSAPPGRPARGLSPVTASGRTRPARASSATAEIDWNTTCIRFSMRSVAIAPLVV